MWVAEALCAGDYGAVAESHLHQAVAEAVSYEKAYAVASQPHWEGHSRWANPFTIKVKHSPQLARERDNAQLVRGRLCDTQIPAGKAGYEARWVGDGVGRTIVGHVKPLRALTDFP